MKYALLLLIPLFCHCYSYSQQYIDSILSLRASKMGEMIDTNHHILTEEEIKHFQGLSYFNVDSTFRIQATFTKSIGKKFKMRTSTERKPIYRPFGYVEFQLNGTTHRLTVFQYIALKRKKAYKNYLFLPLKDATSGNESYAGGRYLDLSIPTTSTVILDFNQLYNPYCVYSYRYSCPIPPEENTLLVPITAGEKVPVGYNTH